MSTLFKTFSKSSKNSDVLAFSASTYVPYIHHHAEYEFFYLEKGSGTFCIENNREFIKADTILFLEPNINHCFTDLSEDAYFHLIVFKPETFGTEDNICRKTLDQIKICKNINLHSDLKNKFITLCKKNNLQSFGLEFQTKAFIFQIISHLLDTNQYIQYSKIESNMDAHSKAVHDTCKYIQEHYFEKIEYDEILTLSNYSKSQFIKIFKKEMNMNVTDYINQCRIEHACLDILNTNKNITEIAIENGFNNVQYFSKRFKETMKCTPREYKSNAAQITGSN